MIDFSGNTSKTQLKQTLRGLQRRVKNTLQEVELLKVKQGLSAVLQHGSKVRRHSKPHWPRRSRAGLNLFEASLWTLLAIVVLVGVLGLYNGVTDSLRTVALRSQLTRAVAIIERDHSRSGIYANGSLLVFLNNEGFSSKELVKESGEYVFTSPFDTDIEIEGTATRDFTVKLIAIPASGCEAAVAAFADKGAGLDSLEIGGVEISATDERAVSVACDTDEGVATVVLTF